MSAVFFCSKKRNIIGNVAYYSNRVIINQYGDNMNNIEEKYFSSLNEQQRRAVQSVDGATLLLAVPGSGKTTVLIRRLGYMINCKGIDPKEILVVTYTVSATKDMKNRYISYFGDKNSELIEFRTINGICAKLLYEFEKNSGKKLYSLADEKTINSILLKICMKYLNGFPSEQDIKNIRTAITYIKNMMLNESEINKYSQSFEIKIGEIYSDYIKIMRDMELMDYDDQMKYAYNILLQFPEVLSMYQNRYKYICVDEAQDTSKIQHAIIRLLASKYNNIFMVGDEDQSIYGFRAAYPEALLDFEKNYPDSNVLLMETNYRSDANIVGMADDFIQNNILRHKKTMKPSREGKRNPEFISVSTREEQYTNLLSIIKGPHDEMAVLYRNNDSAIPLVDYLDREQIPYNIKKSELNFASHKSIKDIKDFIAFAEDPYNTEIFMRIFYKLNLYINKEMAKKICSLSKKDNIPILKALYNCKDNISSYIKDRASELIRYFEQLPTVTARRGMMIILDLINYRQYLSLNNITDGKVETLRILAAKEKTLKSLMERVDKLTDIITNKQYIPDTNLTLTTIHSSKGLEYNTVYLIDVVDWIFPEIIPKKNAMTEEERKLWEEERRLFYVGMTRARNKLYMYDIFKSSVFINELRENIKNKIDRERKIKKLANISNSEKQIQFSFEEFKELLQKDVYIRHNKYGRGKIIGVDKTNISVMFDDQIIKHTFNIRAVYSINAITFEL